jgi:hypothetical protein
MVVRSTKWLKLLQLFVSQLRIKSKELVSTDGNGVPLVMYESQKRFLREVGDGLDNGVHSFNFLKSRQLGITTISLAVDVFWLAVHSGMIACLVNDTEANREGNRAILQGYIESFPEDFLGESFKVTRSNRAMMQFSNGSRLDLLVAGTKKKHTAWAEGRGYALAHLTEVGSYGDVEGLKSLEEGFAQTNPDRLFIYESTAKGMNHWRHRWYTGLDDSTSRSVFIGWWANETNRITRNDPKYAQFGLYAPTGEEYKMMSDVKRLYDWKMTPEQLAWYRWKRIKAGSEQNLLDQNQPCTHEEAFVLTGYSFFEMRTIGKDLKALQDDPPIFNGYRYEVDGDFYNFRLVPMNPEVDSIDRVELKVWEEPVENGRYVIGADPAFGRNDHKDRHACSVFRCFADRIVQVAEYATADVEAKHFAWVIFHLAAAYRNSMTNVELGGPGRLVMAEFIHLRQFIGADMNAARTETRHWQDACSQAVWYLYHKIDSPGAGYMHNFETNFRTMGELMYGYRGIYASREITIRSATLLKEMSNVIVDEGHIGAPDSKNEDQKDDKVFAAALAARAWSDWVQKAMIAEGLTYDVVMSQESGDATPMQVGVNSIVRNFLLKAQSEAEAREELGPPAPEWLEQQGLV